MARLFDDGSTQYLQRAGAVIANMPFTFACWFNSNDTNAKQCLMTQWESGGRIYELAADGPGQDVLFARQWTNNATSTDNWTINTWHHAGGVFPDSDSRTVYLDGKNWTSASTQPNPAITQTAIGRHPGASEYTSGSIAEAAMWNVALSSNEFTVLKNGFSPLFIRPQNLAAYWPLIRDDDQDRIGGFHMTPYNTPTVGTHMPKIIYPSGDYLAYAAAVAAPVVAENIAVITRHLATLRGE